MATNVHRSSPAALACAAILATGCAAGHSSTYVSARQAYEGAAAGQAGALAPSHLYAAKRWLDSATRAKDGSEREQHFAYIAHRKVLDAIAVAHAVALERIIRAARRERERLLERRARQMEAELEGLQRERQSVDQELARIRIELSTQSQLASGQAQALRQREAELLARQRELEAQVQGERDARMQTERKLETAMARLEEFGKVQDSGDETVITISGEVLFRFDDDQLLPTARQRLRTVADALKLQPEGAQIVIEGHTDSKGSAAYNRDLSQRRAQTVREFLAAQGVDEVQLRAIGRGESEPVAENVSPEGRANNRRVEIVIRKAQPTARRE
jgi:outer membrane protein OmpA-like peptidoglycan-associated protein